MAINVHDARLMGKASSNFCPSCEITQKCLVEGKGGTGAGMGWPLIIYGRPPRSPRCALFHFIRISATFANSTFSQHTMHFYRPRRKPGQPGRSTLPCPARAYCPCSSWHNGNRWLTLQFVLLLLLLCGLCWSGCGNNCLPRAALSMGNLTRPTNREGERERQGQPYYPYYFSLSLRVSFLVFDPNAPSPVAWQLSW